ncbi:hypothetical protein V5F53_02710 [Xanthobacter sp. V4C-4]|uniref:hypothetical protein n=1 Tax=Xanthobacter cornucopiae TaxID=3119924 RepID=UPI003726B036
MKSQIENDILGEYFQFVANEIIKNIERRSMIRRGRPMRHTIVLDPVSDDYDDDVRIADIVAVHFESWDNVNIRIGHGAMQ